MISKDATLRITRFTNNLESVASMYEKALGFKVLGKYQDYEGFDGVILGHEQHKYHVEFTCKSNREALELEAGSNFLVFYIPCSREWEWACRALIEARFTVVDSIDPYWNNFGKTFQDIEGYKIVLQNRDWEF